MTDKQIIIDGCDVSGCEYYFDKKCRCMDASIMQDFYLCPQCNSNPNCYYKNWKRKEQECEELDNEAQNLFTEKTNLEIELKELKAKNAKLKNNITSFDYLDLLTNEQVAVLYTASIDELAIRGYKAKYNTEVSLLTRYKQALTEIKEIAETCNSGVSCSACPYTKECRTDLEAEALGVCKMVLKKCEVLNDN